MRFAEVFLRLGTALVAWLLLFAHWLWVAALHVIGCGPDGDELHRLLLGMLPLTVGAGYLIRVARPLVEVQSILTWLIAPLALLMLLALRGIWSVAADVQLQGTAICGTGAPTAWEQAWVPLQLAAWLLVAVVAGKEFKRSH